MRRRKLVALVGLVTIAAIALVAIAVVGVGVGTAPGREMVRGIIQKQLEGQVKGTIHLGKAGGGLLRGFTLDSFAIRDDQDSILVSMGKVSLDYDPRDLMDRRLLLRNVTVENLVVRLQQHANGDWNFERIFRDGGGPSVADIPGRSFGDYVVLDSVRVKNGEFILTMPWEPNDTLTGAKRDSAIKRNLENPEREVRRSSEGFTRTYRWSEIDGFITHARIQHPDSGRFGREFHIAELNVEEREPPFSFRNGRGVVRQLGDSVFFDVSHFELPESRGSAHGRIWWGGDLPIRVDVSVVGDTVALNDVAWVYETLPRTGGGSTKLRIRNNPSNLRDFRYELTDMDVRSTSSRLMGNMTFVAGAVLEVVDVDLRAAPVNFDLVRTLAGEPLPVDWQGDLVGYVRGPGGALTDFVVSESDVTWHDAHVRGAVSRARGRGTLDILDPELTKFKAFDLDVASLDMRSIQYLFPDFLRLGGTVAGSVRLDSLWLDVRFSNANVTHRNGPGEPSRITGSGRVTWADDFMRYDLAVNAQPVSLTMLSRAYPLQLKGLMRGPVRASGTTDDLQVRLDLTGSAGRITWDGRVDAYPLSIAASGTGRLDSLRLHDLIDRPGAPVAAITGPYRVALRADTSDLGTLRGTADLLVERGDFDGLRIFPSRLHATFADRRMRLDTLRVESVPATIQAAGSIGLVERTSDSVHFAVAVDSLGGLRRYVTRLTAAFGDSAAARSDSLAGTLTVTGSLTGSLAALDVSGRLVGGNVFVRREAGREVHGTFAMSNVLSAPAGSASIRFDALNVGGIALDSLGATVQIGEGRTGGFRLGALASNGVTFAAAGDLGLNELRNEFTLRELTLATDSARWMLRAPAQLYASRGSFAVDSLVLVRDRGAGYVRLSGSVPESGPARLLFRADSVSLYDVGRIAQLRAPFSGWASVTVQGAGPATAPVMNLQATLSSVRYGGLRAQRVRTLAEYRNGRAEVSVDLARGQRSSIFARGSLPVELRYFGARLLDDSLSGSIRTDSASLDIVEALVPGLANATGNLVANVDIAGTWKHPDVEGALKVEQGEVDLSDLGVRVRGVQLDMALFGHADSLVVRRMVGWSGDGPGDSASVQGYIAYRNFDNPWFNLRLDARNFRAVDRRSLARLSVSTAPQNPLRLRGPLLGATLTGALVVDRGEVYLPDPELARKQHVALSSAFSDTAAGGVDILPRPPARLMRSLLLDGVAVTLGEDVWLRSREANIKLVGSLTVQRERERRLGAGLGLFGQDSVEYVPLLEGVLRAERGTYTLSLGGIAFQREFQVEGGTVTFLPIAGIDPELNISALHTVRTQASADLRIRVRLTGPLNNPIVLLESAESFALSQSNLVSYLVFGQPSFELGASEGQTLQLIGQQLFLAAPAVAQAGLRTILGSYADFLTVRAAPADASAVGSGQFELGNYLLSSRLGAERQITQNLFVSISTGLCGIVDDHRDDFLSNLSGQIEWRLSRDASVRAGKEPGDLTVICGRQLGRVVPAPSQWGFSLFKTWRF